MAGWLAPSELCEQASAFLDAVYSDERALYPYSTVVVDGRYVSDYRLRGASRYTVNTLLGRARAGAPGVREQLEAFMQRYEALLGAGDRGLLLVLLAELDTPPAELANAVAGAQAAAANSRLDLQDLSWLLWGACRAAEAGVPGAEGLAGELHRELMRLPGRMLARHVQGRLRSHFVSFGGTAYFLRALHEHARVFGDRASRTRFERGIRTAIGFQGPHGEWPWLVGVSSGCALDPYPVFSVHQLAMAPLFLLPALDDGSVDGVAEALRRGYRWAMGENELGLEFGRRDPFLLFRAIERREPFPKAVRYARASLRAALRRPAPSKPARRTRVNREWRSYEAGWLLYAWAGRPDELVNRLGEPPIGR